MSEEIETEQIIQPEILEDKEEFYSPVGDEETEGGDSIFDRSTLDESAFLNRSEIVFEEVLISRI